jgi:hypothetical protein
VLFPPSTKLSTNQTAVLIHQSCNAIYLIDRPTNQPNQPSTAPPPYTQEDQISHPTSTRPNQTDQNPLFLPIASLSINIQPLPPLATEVLSLVLTTAHLPPFSPPFFSVSHCSRTHASTRRIHPRTRTRIILRSSKPVTWTPSSTTSTS